jgi:small subunit ribosomal protein S20
MPLLKHAKKKLRQDKKRTLTNKKVKTLYKALVKRAKENPTPETISEAFSSVDKAAKKFIIHDNKASRIKSALSKLTAESAAAAKDAPRKATKKAKATKVKAVKAAAKISSARNAKKK